MADIKRSYAAKATVAITLTSLANGSGRASTAIDNTTNKYLDALVRVKTNGSAAGNTSTVDIYAYAALGDTTYTDGVSGTDAAAIRRNAIYLGSVTLNGTTSVTGGPFSVAAAFGGTMPEDWGLLLVNNSGASLSATAGDHVVEYQGVYATSV